MRIPHLIRDTFHLFLEVITIRAQHTTGKTPLMKRALTSCLSLLLFFVFGFTSSLSAKVVWLVGANAAIDSAAVAPQLSAMLGDEPVDVLPFDYLCSLPTVYTDNAFYSANQLLITLAPGEDEGLAFLGLLSIQANRPIHLPKATIVAVQKPIYKMSGLCDNSKLQRTARLAIGANLNFIALPKVWQQVYTDDTFYNGKVPKGAVTEAYVAAAGLAMALREDEEAITSLSGVHPEVADELKASIRKGLFLTDEVLYAANHLPNNAFDLRVGDAFDAILFDGAFERKVGAWLEAIALADNRKLTLHYTTDTDINTGWPTLFRTTQTLGQMSNATVYTRPAFTDASEEISHLNTILKADAQKPGWLPFQLAVAEWVRRYPDIPVYNGAEPTEATAAMFAAMLYLKWTGAPVVPANCDQVVNTAISIGLDTMLRKQRLYRDVNAVFCRPLGNNRFAFSLWRKPADKVTLRLDTDTAGKRVSSRKLTFSEEDYWTPKTISVEGPCTFFWKISAKHFPGQNTGARVIR